MKRIFCILVLMASQSATAQEKPGDVPVMEAARRSVAAELRDPESARFSHLLRTTGQNQDGKPRDVVCGLVNGKNGFGGYAGATMFIYYVASKEANVSKNHYHDEIILKMCKPPAGVKP